MNDRDLFGIRSALLAALLAFSVPSQAQPTPDGRLLGLTESELQARFDAVQRLKKPMPGPHGLRGLWTLPNTPVSGWPFETVFYLKNKRVARIEQHWISTEPLCSDQPAAFVSLVSEMQSKYGTGLTSSNTVVNDTTQRSAAWQTDAFAVRTYLSQNSDQCMIRVVYETLIDKDASEL